MESRTEHLERARRQALRLVGVEPTDVFALFDAAAQALGEARAGRTLELVHRSRLTSRHHAVAAVAALVVGTPQLGTGWWLTPHVQHLGFDDTEEFGTPDELLGSDDVGSRRVRSCLPTLEIWIADATADALWGAPVDTADLNRPWTIDVVDLPDGVEAGQRLVVAYDPGGRLDAIVEDRTGGPTDEVTGRGRRGSLGSRLDLDSCRYSEPAEASWAVSVSSCRHTLVLPDEQAVANPWHRPVDPAASEVLRSWAATHGIDSAVLGPEWATAADVFATLVRMDWPWGVTGRTWTFWRAAEALIDDVRDELAGTIAQLGGDPSG